MLKSRNNQAIRWGWVVGDDGSLMCEHRKVVVAGEVVVVKRDGKHAVSMGSRGGSGCSAETRQCSIIILLYEAQKKEK